MFEQVQQARQYAVCMHGSQRYGGHPYVVHLDAVAGLLVGLPGVDQETLVIAYLHDVVEDTPATQDDITDMFGESVSSCVELLTDCPGPSRAIRKEATYKRFRRAADNPSLWRAFLVKAADRLANMRAGITEHRRPRRYYIEEASMFSTCLRIPSVCRMAAAFDHTWSMLDEIVSRFPLDTGGDLR